MSERSPNEPESQAPNDPILVVLSGPSGVGKDAVLSRMRELRMPYHFTVTATTRPQRPGEQDGIDYYFVSQEAFDKMSECDELLESAEVYGNRYGVPKGPVLEALESGLDVIIKADVQGAATIRNLAPDALLIFLAPPDMVELERRLRERMTESNDALARRLHTAELEMERVDEFDYVVVNHNGHLDDAAWDIDAIIERERRRSPPRLVTL